MDLVKKHDLTFIMSPFLDAHMVSALLDFLRENNVYDTEQITKEKIKCVSLTNMVTLVEDEYERLASIPAVKAEYEQKKDALEKSKDAIFAALDNPSPDVALVTEFFANGSTVADLKSSSDLTLEVLNTKYNISTEALESYFKYAKFQYECGMYQDAEVMLTNYLSITQSTSPTVVAATWGRLACHIVQGFWEPSKDDLKELKEAIEIRSTAPMEQLRQRGWICHWSLFVHFTQRDSYDSFLEFIGDRVYLQTMENICPWLLRYYAVAVLLGSRRKHLIRDLLSEIQNLSHLYTDPILSFISTLYESFDIDLTQLKLKESLTLMRNDFFLCAHAQNFADLARMIMCEMYCTMYSCIDLKSLSDKLELTEDEAERWMVSMVKTTTPTLTTGQGTDSGDKSNMLSVNLDARIDASAKQVIIAPPSHNIFQQVVDRTRDLTARSNTLNTNMSTLLQEQGILIRNR